MTIAPSVQRLFWGDNLKDLVWENHEKYITETVLDRGDISDVAWLFTVKSKESLLSELPTLKLQPRSKAFWAAYLS